MEVKTSIEYNRSNLGTLLHLAKFDNPLISSYEEWTEIINREFQVDMTVDEVIEYFAMERDMEDHIINLRNCGR